MWGFPAAPSQRCCHASHCSECWGAPGWSHSAPCWRLELAGCQLNPTLMGQSGTQALHPKAFLNHLPFVPKGHGVGNGRRSPTVCCGLIFPCICALHTGIKVTDVSSVSIRNEPTWSAGIRDAASQGAWLQQGSTPIQRIPKFPGNPECLHPSKTPLSGDFFSALGLTVAWGWRQHGGYRTRRLRLWEPLALRMPNSCQAGGSGLQKATLNIIAGLRFGSASQPEMLPSHSFPLRAYSQDTQAGGEHQ